jgi:hypothetical protein
MKTLALTLTLSPGEREQRAIAFGDSRDGDIATDLRIISKRRNIPPLLGERAGVREDN